MTWTDNEFDEYGKRVLSPLRPAPSLDPQVAAEAKEQFLMHGESLGHGLISQPGGLDLEQRLRKPNVFLGTQRNTLMKALAGVLLAILIILAVSSITVYAAQSSLPGEPLYTIKSWGEDLRLSMTFSTKAKLNLTLDYTNRRVNEISDILAGGKTLNDQSSDRFKRELDYALLLAAQLDNTQIQNALGQINSQAENQGITLEKLIKIHPSQAEPAMVNLISRLDEQVQLSVFGESDPQAFRMQIHERLNKGKGPKHTSATIQAYITPTDLSGTPVPGQNGHDNGNKMHQPSDVPGHGGEGNGKGQSTPGNGNRKPHLTRTPTP